MTAPNNNRIYFPASSFLYEFAVHHDRILMCRFEQRSFDYFCRLTETTPAPWPFGPFFAIEEGRFALDDSEGIDTANFANWSSDANRPDLVLTLALASRIELDELGSTLLPLSAVESIDSVLSPEEAQTISIYDPKDWTRILELADLFLWCGLTAWEGRGWFVILGRRLAHLAQTATFYESATSFVLPGWPTMVNDGMYLEATKPPES